MLFSKREPNRVRDIDVILTSSGVRAPAFVGGLRALIEGNYNIKRIAGTSGGAIVAAGFALGKSIDEMESLTQTIPYASFRDFHFSNLLSLRNPSIYSGKPLDTYYKALFGDARLKDFEIDCRITVVSIAGREQKILDRSGYPDLPVWEAVRMSSTIPFIFPYLTLDGIPVTDGGLDIRTQDIFPDKQREVVVLRPRADYNLKSLVQGGQAPLNSKLFIWNYLRLIAEYLLDAVDLQHLADSEWEKTIILPTYEVGGFSFNLTPERIAKLVQDGYDAVAISLPLS